jgi:hypothetical protein
MENLFFGNAWLRTSDARDKYRTPAPAQPLDALSYLLTSAPADQHATSFFPLASLTADAFAGSRRELHRKLRAGGGGRRELRVGGGGSSAASSTPEEAAAGSSAASHAPRPQGWSSPRRRSRCPGRRGGAPRREAASQADGSSSMVQEKREATTATSTARTRGRPRFGPRGSRPGRNVA